MKTCKVLFDRAVRLPDNSFHVCYCYKQFDYSYSTIEELIIMIKEECKNIVNTKDWAKIEYVIAAANIYQEGVEISIKVKEIKK